MGPALDEALPLARELGDKRLLAMVLSNVALVPQLAGDYASARAYYEEALQLCRELDNAYGNAVILSNLGDVALAEGDLERAREHLLATLDGFRQLGYVDGTVNCLASIASLAADLGDHVSGAVLLAAAELQREQHGLVVSATDEPRANRTHGRADPRAARRRRTNGRTRPGPGPGAGGSRRPGAFDVVTGAAAERPLESVFVDPSSHRPRRVGPRARGGTMKRTTIIGLDRSRRRRCPPWLRRASLRPLRAGSTGRPSGDRCWDSTTYDGNLNGNYEVAGFDLDNGLPLGHEALELGLR